MIIPTEKELNLSRQIGSLAAESAEIGILPTYKQQLLNDIGNLRLEFGWIKLEALYSGLPIGVVGNKVRRKN